MNGRDNGCAAENGSVMSGQKKKRWRNMERMHKVKQKDGENGVMGLFEWRYCIILT